MQQQLGTEYPDFMAALDLSPPVSVHCHPHKACPFFFLSEKVPWHPQLGRYLAERPVFTLDPVFHAGAYYVQEASSMLIAEAMQQTLDLSTPLRVLDLCAAPGGKSTLMASLLTADSLLLSNEVIQSRYATLRHNLAKWGMPHVQSSNHGPEDFSGLASFFDLVLVDAPCSGEGLFRKDTDAMAEWSPANVTLCAGRQQRILAAAARLLRSGGILLYSTCTYNATENDDNCHWLTQNFDLQPVPLQLPADWGIATMPGGYQCYPHRVRGEGFFLAAFRSTAESVAASPKISDPAFRNLSPLPRALQSQLARWAAQPGRFSFFLTEKGRIRAIPTALLSDLAMIDKCLRRKLFGIDIGEIKGRDFVPSHELALSTMLAGEVARLALSRELALRFLKKETLNLDTSLRGWAVATHDGLPLGWVKILPQRINNYLPLEWRIRMEVG
jgi:16S rRNA C967 or C1407 C5-methylase (RsmB/RsmF family)/NOL1/NOP2/fmu family ribosome biogenesis protein